MQTDNKKLQDSQNALAKYLVLPFNAENGPLIMVRQLTPGKVWCTVCPGDISLGHEISGCRAPYVELNSLPAYGTNGSCGCEFPWNVKLLNIMGRVI